MDDRAQAIGIARFFLALAVGAVLYYVVDRVTNPVLDQSANATGNATANQATGWLRDSIGLMPTLILVLGFLGIVVLAIYQREVVS